MSLRSKLSRIKFEINHAHIKKKSIEIHVQVSVAGLMDKRKEEKCPSAELNQAWIHGDISMVLFIFIIKTKLTFEGEGKTKSPKGC